MTLQQAKSIARHLGLTLRTVRPVGWVTSGNYCVPGSDKAPAAISKNGWCPAGWRESGSYCIR